MEMSANVHHICGCRGEFFCGDAIDKSAITDRTRTVNTVCDPSMVDNRHNVQHCRSPLNWTSGAFKKLIRNADKHLAVNP